MADGYQSLYSDSRSYVDGVPHAYSTYLRHHDPVHWQDEPGGPGFWAVTRYEDCVAVNRDYERFSSGCPGHHALRDRRGRDRPAGPDDAQHGPSAPHRYRRLVNKGFTPRMVRDLEESIHRSADAIIDEVIEKGGPTSSPRFPPSSAAGHRRAARCAPDDRHRMFEWSNRMVGNEDPDTRPRPSWR